MPTFPNIKTMHSHRKANRKATAWESIPVRGITLLARYPGTHLGCY